jgi:voltage-gated potassium channel
VAARLIGGTWIVVGFMLFFGTIVATITTCFMQPMQVPHKGLLGRLNTTLNNSMTYRSKKSIY